MCHRHPSNQVIHVVAAKPVPADQNMQAVWLRAMSVAAAATDMGNAGYRIEAVKVAPYAEELPRAEGRYGAASDGWHQTGTRASSIVCDDDRRSRCGPTALAVDGVVFHRLTGRADDRHPRSDARRLPITPNATIFTPNPVGIAAGWSVLFLYRSSSFHRTRNVAMKSAALSLLVAQLTACMSGPPERSQVSAARSIDLMVRCSTRFRGSAINWRFPCPLCGWQVSAPQLAATAPPSAVASIDPRHRRGPACVGAAAAVASAELELPPKLADPISKVAVSPSEEGRSTPVALKLDVELASIAHGSLCARQER